jgi:hypothetical protein
MFAERFENGTILILYAIFERIQLQKHTFPPENLAFEMQVLRNHKSPIVQRIVCQELSVAKLI